MRHLRHPVVLLSLLACTLVLLLFVWGPQAIANRLATNLAAKIQSADDEAAIRQISALAALGEASFPHLVRLLDDERQQLRIAAREALRHQLEQCETQLDARGDKQSAQLAATFAAQPLPRDVYSRLFVKLAVLRLLKRPMQTSTVNESHFLANCSAVLEMTGDLYVQEPERVTREAAHVTSPPEVEEAEQETEFTVAPIVEPEQQPELLPRYAGRVLPPSELHPEEPRELDVPRPEEISVDSQSAHSLPTRSLIRHLHSAPVVAEAARQELRRRGFTSETIHLAHQLDHPDRNVRLKLVEALPGLDSVNATAWLWELTQDEDAGVREAARSILSTSTNPLTQRRLQSLK